MKETKQKADFLYEYEPIFEAYKQLTESKKKD